MQNLVFYAIIILVSFFWGILCASKYGKYPTAIFNITAVSLGIYAIYNVILVDLATAKNVFIFGVSIVFGAGIGFVLFKKSS